MKPFYLLYIILPQLFVLLFRRLKIEKEKEREKKEERISEFPETTVISTTTPERQNKTSTSSQVIRTS